MAQTAPKEINTLNSITDTRDQKIIPQKREAKSNWTAFLGIICILAIIVCFLATRYDDIPQIKREAYQDTVKSNNVDHQRVMSRIEDEIQKWTPDIEKAVNVLTSPKGSLHLSYLMIKDKLTGSEDAPGLIADTINTYVLMGSTEMVHNVEALLTGLQRELNVNSRAMINQLSHQLPAELNMSFTRMEQHIDSLSNNIGTISLKTTLANIDFIITAALLNRIYSQLTHVLKVVGKRVLKTQALALTSAAIDGPLFFGDMVGIGIEVAGLSWAGWELYQAQKVMKPKIEQEIRNAVELFKEEILAASSNTAQAMVTDANRNNKSITGTLNFFATLKYWADTIYQSTREAVSQSLADVSA